MKKTSRRHRRGTVVFRHWLSLAGISLAGLAFAATGFYLLRASHAATFATSADASSGTITTPAAVYQRTAAAHGAAVQFGAKAGDCNNFCSTPVNPIYRTARVTINTKVNTAWCGPTWDAPQAEFDAARQKMGADAILMPPCKKGGGYYDQTPEQYKTELDKAAKAGVKVLVFAGYTCSNAWDHNCYQGYSNPDAAIDKFAYHPALAGFFIHDEPPMQEFAKTGVAVNRVLERRPGLLAYTNLLGSFGSLAAKSSYGLDANGKVPTFDQYVNGFIKNVKIPVLSVDDYTSTAGLDLTLKTINDAVVQAQPGRPDLADYSLWSAISTVGLPDGRDAATMAKLRPQYEAVNTKYNAKTLFFTWRSPPGGGDGFTQPATGAALCGLVNNYKAGTMCGN